MKTSVLVFQQFNVKLKKLYLTPKYSTDNITNIIVNLSFFVYYNISAYLVGTQLFSIIVKKISKRNYLL